MDGQHVLVVDELTDTPEVLKAILTPRGLTVECLSQQRQDAAEPPRRPDLVVINAEALPSRFHSTAQWGEVPKVIIGSVEHQGDIAPVDTETRRHFSQPFQYPELLRAVEQLLAGSDHCQAE